MILLVLILILCVVLFYFGIFIGFIESSSTQFKAKSNWQVTVVLYSIIFFAGIVFAYLVSKVLGGTPSLTGGKGMFGSASVIDLLVVLFSFFGNFVVALFLRQFILRDSSNKIRQELHIQDRLNILEEILELEDLIYNLSPPNYKKISVEIKEKINVLTSMIKRKVTFQISEKQLIMSELSELQIFIDEYKSFGVTNQDDLFGCVDRVKRVVSDE